MEPILLAGGVLLLIILLRGGTDSTKEEKKDDVPKTEPPVGAWIPADPADIAATPTLKSGFAVGEDVYVALKQYKMDSVVIARVRVDEVLGDEATGPLGRGKAVRFVDYPTPEDFFQVEGTAQPEIGQVFTVPIAFVLNSDFLKDLGVDGVKV